MTRRTTMALASAFLAATLACQTDAPTQPSIETVVTSAAWDEKVNGNGLFDALKWSDISVSVSVTSFPDQGDKGMVQYSRTHADGDLDMQIDVQCLTVSEDGTEAAMAGPLRVQVNTDPQYSSSGTYVDGDWWRFYIKVADGTQGVRIHKETVGTCAVGGTTPGTIHTNGYRIRN